LLLDCNGRIRQARQAIAHDDAHIGGVAVPDLVSIESRNFGSLVAFAGPQPQDVAFTGRGDADPGIDRPFSHLAVSDLDVDRIDEDPIERPLAPLGHLAVDLYREVLLSACK
jgi:hypothetical protein